MIFSILLSLPQRWSNLFCIGIPGRLPTARNTRLWLTILARRLRLGPDCRSQPQRISCRICQLNSRGIKFNLFDTAGGIQKAAKKWQGLILQKKIRLLPLIRVKGEDGVLWKAPFLKARVTAAVQCCSEKLGAIKPLSFGSSGALHNWKHLLTNAALLM